VAGELLEKETLRQDDLERLFADVVKRPRITEFDDFAGRVPTTREPVKTPGELARERGEPWPPPSTDPFAQTVLPRRNGAGDRSGAGELLEKETLRQDDLERLFADVVKRPRITEFDDFAGRVPTTREPVKTPGELARERGEPWPPPSTDPFAQTVLPRRNGAGD